MTGAQGSSIRRRATTNTPPLLPHTVHMFLVLILMLKASAASASRRATLNASPLLAHPQNPVPVSQAGSCMVHRPPSFSYALSLEPMLRAVVSLARCTAFDASARLFHPQLILSLPADLQAGELIFYQLRHRETESYRRANTNVNWA